MTSRPDSDIPSKPDIDHSSPSLKKVMLWILAAALGLLLVLWGQEGFDAIVDWLHGTFGW